MIIGYNNNDHFQGVMKLLINHENGKKAGVLIPIPQYPLYSATIAEFDLHQVRLNKLYFLK